MHSVLLKIFADGKSDPGMKLKTKMFLEALRLPVSVPLAELMEKM